MASDNVLAGLSGFFEGASNVTSKWLDYMFAKKQHQNSTQDLLDLKRQELPMEEASKIREFKAQNEFQTTKSIESENAKNRVPAAFIAPALRKKLGITDANAMVDYRTISPYTTLEGKELGQKKTIGQLKGEGAYLPPEFMNSNEFDGLSVPDAQGILRNRTSQSNAGSRNATRTKIAAANMPLLRRAANKIWGPDQTLAPSTPAASGAGSDEEDALVQSLIQKHSQPQE